MYYFARDNDSAFAYILYVVLLVVASFGKTQDKPAGPQIQSCAVSTSCRFRE
jgi:hypothetical protein